MLDLGMNERAWALADSYAARAAELRIAVHALTSGARVIDAGVRVPGGLASPLARLLANAYVEELGADLDDVSAITVVDLLRDSPRDRVSPYEESDQRYHIRGGNDQLVQRLAEPIASRIETGARLVALARRGDGRYRLTFARDGTMRDVDADQGLSGHGGAFPYFAGAGAGAGAAAGVAAAGAGGGGGAFPLHMSRYSCQVDPFFFHRTIAFPSGRSAIKTRPSASISATAATSTSLKNDSPR